MHNQLISLQKTVDRNDSQEVNADISHSERFLIKAGEQGFQKRTHADVSLPPTSNNAPTVKRSL